MESTEDVTEGYKSSADEFREIHARTMASLDAYQSRSAIAREVEHAVASTPHFTEKSKESNPKDIVGSNKLPLHLFPTTATAYGCLAMLEGLLKYGKDNFRAIGVRYTIYYDALRRHMDAWLEGEDIDPDSGLPHLGKALACIAILIDATAAGKIEDDRKVAGGYAETIASMTPHVARLKGLHADKAPRHYTIEDVP